MFKKYNSLVPGTLEFLAMWMGIGLFSRSILPGLEHITPMYLLGLSGQCLQGNVGGLSIQAEKSTCIMKDEAEVGKRV